ncbi:Hypothetical predicted protein, partial [Paramuricea clavata]
SLQRQYYSIAVASAPCRFTTSGKHGISSWRYAMARHFKTKTPKRKMLQSGKVTITE